MTVTTNMTSMSALPSKAVDEIMARLGERQRISSDEIVAILKKYEVAGDAEALQDSYRKRLGQRFMAAIRDEAGRREIFAAGKNYVIVDCCNNAQELKAIRRRLQSSVNGLDSSVQKVGGRLQFLDRFAPKVGKEAED